MKRQWGITHTLVKGLEKVDAEIGITYTAYNLVRCCTILNPLELIKRLKQVFLCILNLWCFLMQEVNLKIKLSNLLPQATLVDEVERRLVAL